MKGGYGGLASSQGFDVFDGLFVIDNLKVFTQALAAGGQPRFQDKLGFAQGEGIALDSVGIVNPLDCNLLVKATRRRCWQGTQGIELGFFLFQAGQQT